MPIKVVDVNSEYAKSKDLKKEDVQALQQWMNKQPHLPKISELQILLFLHSCYCKMEPTKATIEAFFSLQTHCPDIFSNRDPNQQQLMESMDCGLFAPLPKHTPEGYRVLFFSLVGPDPSKFFVQDMIKLFDMSIRLWLQEDGTAEGLIFLVDSTKITLSHIARISIMSLKHFFTYLQEALPVRLKGMHFINAGAGPERLVSLSRPFIKSELNKMLHLHAGVPEKMYQIVPLECFPEDHGGTADSISKLHALAKKKLLDNAQFFIEDEKLKTDESKRIGKPPNFVNVDYGMDGSFKKLELD